MEEERDAWFDPGVRGPSHGWDTWSEALAKLLHKDDLESILLEPKEGTQL